MSEDWRCNGCDSCKTECEAYSHVYVIIEHIDGKILPVSLEMLGEARRLFDDYNARYSSNEKVVAVILGNGIKDYSKTSDTSDFDIMSSVAVILHFVGTSLLSLPNIPTLKHF